jgi:hypothetical protein
MYKKIDRSLLWMAGSIMTIAVLGKAFIRYHFGFLDAVLLIIGAACMMASVWKFKRPHGAAKIGGNGMRAAAGIAVTVILLAVLNAAALKYDRAWDVTASKQHTLAGYTKDYIRGLKMNVRLTAFFVGIPPQYLTDMLAAYEKESGGRIKAEIIDPLVDLGYAAQFGNVISGKESKIFVQTELGRKDIDFTAAPLTEEQLTNEIVRLTRPLRKVYFLAGHNEADIENDEPEGLQSFAELLERNRIATGVLVLGEKGSIPADSDALVIAGPKRHLTASEEETVREYLDKGGDALIMTENVYVTTPDQPLTKEQQTLYPSLNGVLADWGLRVNDDIVVDMASHVGGDVGSPATRNYMPHRALVNDVDYTFFIRPRSISLLPDRREGLKLAPVILTASEKQSWGETNRYLQVKFNSAEDRPGPIPFAYVAYEPRDASENKTSDTRIFVITDTDFISNQFLDEYGNAVLAMNVINWLIEADYRSFMKTKTVSVEKLELTSRQKRSVLAVLMAMPLFVIILECRYGYGARSAKL